MTQPGQPGYSGLPDKPAAPVVQSDPDADPRTLAPKMVGQTQDDQADNAAKGTSAMPQAAGEDLSAKAARLEEELAEVRARASRQETVRIKVEGVHSAFTHNGLTVGTDYTNVPMHAVAAMMEAASDSHVKLTQEEV